MIRPPMYCALLIAFSASVWAAKPAPKLNAKTETLTCRMGTEDRHARIGVVLVGGKTDSFAYYSKWKPRTCSIYLQRSGDGYSKWRDNGSVTTVNLESGLFMIEHRPGEYRFVFKGIDRERYCGMEGTINGTLTIRKGSERCELAGVMEEGVPLGQAWAQEQNTRSAEAPPLPASVAATTPSAATRAPSATPPTSKSTKATVAVNRYRHQPIHATVVIGD